MGVAGKAGTSLHPLMFGNVADIAINEEGVLYIADGDGGVNNRVVKVELSELISSFFKIKLVNFLQ